MCSEYCKNRCRRQVKRKRSRAYHSKWYSKWKNTQLPWREALDAHFSKLEALEDKLSVILRRWKIGLAPLSESMCNISAKLRRAERKRRQAQYRRGFKTRKRNI